MSGISINDELFSLFEEMKLRRRYKYIVFGLKKVGMEGNKIKYDWEIYEKVETSSMENEDNANCWKAMTAGLPQDDGRFVLFDWSAKANDGRIIQKIVLLKWCPDSTAVNIKMLMGSTHQTLKQKLQGLSRDVQAADSADVEVNSVTSAVLAGV